MKPKNKLQRRVVELSDQLPKITQEQKQFGYTNCLGRYGVVSRNRIFCFECSHKWQGDTSKKKQNCPNCNEKIKLQKNTIDEDYGYLFFFDRQEDFQVIRVLFVHKTMKRGKKPEFYSSEVAQYWIDQNGKLTTMAKLRGNGFTSTQWIFHTKLEIRVDRSYHDKYSIYPCKIYPKGKIISQIKRNGFKTGFYGIRPQVFFTNLLTNPRVETLLKTRQLTLLNTAIKNPQKIEKYWNSIKLCIRNNYQIQEADIWFDYLELLEFFGKDLRNTKFICPDDLHTAHNRLVDKKRNKIRREKLHKLKEDIQKAQMKYRKEKEHFFNLMFSDKELIVKPINHVKDFLVEGDMLRHCIFVNEYYKKQNSLLLSARINDTVVETIEVSLSRMEIVQARGYKNKPTKHNRRIVKLVKDNLPQIIELHQKESKRA